MTMLQVLENVVWNQKKAKTRPNDHLIYYMYVDMEVFDDWLEVLEAEGCDLIVEEQGGLTPGSVGQPLTKEKLLECLAYASIDVLELPPLVLKPQP